MRKRSALDALAFVALAFVALASVALLSLHTISASNLVQPEAFTSPASGASAPSASRADLAARRVILFGDSLGWEAEGFFRSSLAGSGIPHATTNTFGGTAMCDWLPQMREAQARLHPDAVVVEFSGNAFTPCMKDTAGAPLTGSAYYAKYTADVQQVLRIFAPDKTLVVLVGTPLSQRAERQRDPASVHLNAIYAAISARNGEARYVDAGASVLSGGRWTKTLPCLPAEPCTGGTDTSGRPVNVVRAPDGGHFCPVARPAINGVTAACPVWSSGAYRFGVSMAHRVASALASEHVATGGSEQAGS
jgi:hypothetical protein